MSEKFKKALRIAVNLGCGFEGDAEDCKRLFNKDVPFITYIIHDKNMKNGRTVTVYKPTQEYYILFELIKFRRLPSTFPDIGITVISEGLEPSSRSIK